MGKGPAELLENIGQLGSIRKAARRMNMSYSKAHGMIKKLEKKLKKKLLEKSIGGETGGGAVLTRAADMLIADYRKLERDIKKYAGRNFNELKSRYVTGKKEKV